MEYNENMETNLLSPVATPTSQLSWVAEDQQFVGEVSSTNGFGRVFNDACDEGMTLFNRATGRSVVVAIDHVEVIDGEVVSWTLKPVQPSKLARPFTVLLFND